MLEQDETLSQFIERAVHDTVLKRRSQDEFVRRGITAIEQTKHAADGTPADVVIAKLEAKLANARQLTAI